MKAIIISNTDRLPAVAEYIHGDMYVIDEDDDTYQIDGIEVELEEDEY